MDVCDTAKVRFFKQITTHLQESILHAWCLWYCKSTIFQANHNKLSRLYHAELDVCDTAKVRFFKQITTGTALTERKRRMFVILQKYDFSSKSQQRFLDSNDCPDVCDTAKVRFFKQITTGNRENPITKWCLWYCKSTIFQANHNRNFIYRIVRRDVCDTAKVRFFKQITTTSEEPNEVRWMFVILQKYDFSSKSQRWSARSTNSNWCLWYCKSTIFQANHNPNEFVQLRSVDVCDTAKVRFFKQITTDFSFQRIADRCLWYCKSTIFQANHNAFGKSRFAVRMFVILQKYDFSSKSQPYR